MKNLKKVTDSQLAKWRFNPSDRKANVIHLGVLGMSVEIQKCGEIAFAVRMVEFKAQPSKLELRITTR